MGYNSSILLLAAVWIIHHDSRAYEIEVCKCDFFYGYGLVLVVVRSVVRKKTYNKRGGADWTHLTVGGGGYKSK